MSERTGISAPRRRPDPLVGTVVAGRFRIEARIAAGGMGTVYRAEQLGLDRKVALKLLHAGALEGTEDSQAQDDLAVLEKRFSREAAILAKLAHPNVVTVFDYGRLDDGDPYDRSRPKFFMVMELLAGDTLQERLSRDKYIPVDAMLPIARQIARGLREAHALGIVHRDLKPANVMLVRDRDGDEVVKLLDFGIGKILDRDPFSQDASEPGAELTQEGRFVGSPLYMSPEQIAHGRVDARTDIYTLGVVLYRCLAGIHPFHKDRTALVMLAHLHEQAIPLRQRVPDVPAWLGDLVDGCLHKDPERRPASMDEVYHTLTENTGPRSVGLGPIDPLPTLEDPPTVSSGNLPVLRPSMPAPNTMTSGALTQPTLPGHTPPPRKWWPLAVVGGAVAITVAVIAMLPRGSNEQPSPANASSAPSALDDKPAPQAPKAAASTAPSVAPSQAATVAATAAPGDPAEDAAPKPAAKTFKPTKLSGKPTATATATAPPVVPPDINLKR